MSHDVIKQRELEEIVALEYLIQDLSLPIKRRLADGATVEPGLIAATNGLECADWRMTGFDNCYGLGIKVGDGTHDFSSSLRSLMARLVTGTA